MSNFIGGFSDELEKLGGAASSVAGIGKWMMKGPWRRILLPAMLLTSGIAGARAAGKKKRILHARPGQPSAASRVNFSRALGLKRLSKLQQARESRHFARYRGKK